MHTARPPPHQAKASGRQPPPVKRGRVTYDQLDPARNQVTPEPAAPDPSSTDNDAALFSHNLIFQKAILETLDRETARFEEELRDKADELSEVRASKEDMAVFLAHQLKENKRLASQLRAARAALEAANNNAKSLKSDTEALKRNEKALAAQNDDLSSKVSTLAADLEKSKDVVRGTQLATAAFHADIKVRTLTQARPA